VFKDEDEIVVEYYPTRNINSHLRGNVLAEEEIISSQPKAVEEPILKPRKKRKKENESDLNDESSTVKHTGKQKVRVIDTEQNGSRPAVELMTKDTRNQNAVDVRSLWAYMKSVSGQQESGHQTQTSKSNETAHRVTGTEKPSQQQKSNKKKKTSDNKKTESVTMEVEMEISPSSSSSSSYPLLDASECFIYKVSSLYQLKVRIILRTNLVFSNSFMFLPIDLISFFLLGI
jgi:acetyl/propionyl-CoA carboxylase alpha subunit